jgi:AcrR family transcriptional regulator
MSQIAARTGIGRATLYKYFPDVETILIAWHDRQVGDHLRHLAEVRGQTTADHRLEAVMEAYALIHHRRVRQHSHQPHATELAVFVHQDEHVARAQQQVRDMVRELLAEAVESGQVRQDVAADELASYCVHALAAASGLPSETAVRRLVAVVLSGLRPSPPIPDRGTAGG